MIFYLQIFAGIFTSLEHTERAGNRLIHKIDCVEVD